VELKLGVLTHIGGLNGLIKPSGCVPGPLFLATLPSNMQYFDVRALHHFCKLC
jgi:hypothetical protein